MIDCREAVRRMWSYLERELETRPETELEMHLETCRRCCGELEFSRHLRRMVAENGAVPPMPVELRSRIELLLEERPTDRGGNGVTEIHIEGDDLLSQEAIRSVVQATYARVEPTDRRVAERFYPSEDLAPLPDETVRMALGVGHPVGHTNPGPGEDVVDLGSGGGIDCLLAAIDVGPAGSVVGVDFLADMVERAGRAASAAGLPNVRFVEGMIESLPIEDSSVDVVISNGVVNLSPRKVRVLAEAFRVLRPGGRLAIVDLVLEHDLPPEIQTHPAAWAGCLSGALSEIALYKGLRRAGFREVSIEPLEPFGIAECGLYPLFGEDLLAMLRDRVPTARHERIAMSVLARGRKPAPGEQLAGRARE